MAYPGDWDEIGVAATAARRRPTQSSRGTGPRQRNSAPVFFLAIGLVCASLLAGTLLTVVLFSRGQAQLSPSLPTTDLSGR